jgi:hypothetical protein
VKVTWAAETVIVSELWLPGRVKSYPPRFGARCPRPEISEDVRGGTRTPLPAPMQSPARLASGQWRRHYLVLEARRLPAFRLALGLKDQLMSALAKYLHHGKLWTGAGSRRA